MGRVRTKQVKFIGKKLYGLYKDDFKPDFRYNKGLISKYVEVRSKRLGNFIAGYITHLVKKNMKEKSNDGKLVLEKI